MQGDLDYFCDSVLMEVFCLTNELNHMNRILFFYSKLQTELHLNVYVQKCMIYNLVLFSITR